MSVELFCSIYFFKYAFYAQSFFKLQFERFRTFVLCENFKFIRANAIADSKFENILNRVET